MKSTYVVRPNVKNESFQVNLYGAFFFAALLLLFFPETICGGKVLIAKMGDTHTGSYSFAVLFKTLGHAGIFPLWNPLIFCGTPFGADSFVNLNMLHLASFWIKDINSVWNFLILAKVFLAGFCTFLFMIQLGLHPAAGLIAGIIVAFAPGSGSYSSAIDSWIFCLPLSLWQIEKFYAQKKVRHLFYIFLCFSMLFLNAMPQHALYTGVFFAAYVLFRFRSLLGAWILVFAVGATSFHLFRLLELLTLSPRGHLHLWIVNVLLPTHLIEFIFPHLFESQIHPEVGYFFSKGFQALVRFLFHSDQIQYMSLPYFGILGFTCALLARKGRGPVRFFRGAVIAILFYLITFPIFAPFYKHIPILAQLFRLERLYCVLTFALAILAGIGIDRCILQKINIKRITVFYGTIMFFIVGMLSFFRYFVFSHSQQIRGFLSGYIEHHILGSPQHKAPLDFYLKRIDEFFLFIRHWADPLSASIALPILWVFLTLLLLYLWQQEKIRRRFFLAGCICVAFFELLSYSKASPSKTAMPQDLVSNSLIIRYLEADAKKEIFRVAPILEDAFYGQARERDILAPNLNVIYGVSSIEGYNPQFPRTYSTFVKNFQTDYEKDPGMVLLGTEDSFDYALTDFLNVKYFITKRGQKLKRDLPIAYEDAKNVLYLNPTYFPRAFLVQNYEVRQDQDQILSILRKKKANLKNFCVLEEKPDRTNKVSAGPVIKVDEIIIEKYLPDMIRMKVSAVSDCLLILTDNYFPGWKAMIDGRPTKILRADFSFRAISVPSGAHLVDFFYKPESFRFGIFASVFFIFAGLAALISWMIVCRIKL